MPGKGGFRMLAKRIVTGALIGLAWAAPAHAGDRPDPFAQVEALLAPEVMLQGVIREDDVALVFAHLRAALIAAEEGREAPPPDALNQRAEAIAAEMKARGTVMGLVLMNAFEAAARQALSDALADAVPPATR
jgi:hypothetical protein